MTKRATKKAAKKTAKKKPTKPASGRADKKKNHPEFTAKQITEDNLQLFLKVFPENHRLFVLEYTRTWNARAAYHKVFPGVTEGTAKVNGHKLLRDKKVQLYLDWLAYVKNEKYEFDVAEYDKDLDDYHKKCMAAKPVLDKDGNQTGEYRFDSAGAGKALDLKAKRHGLQTKKIELTEGNVPHFIVHQLVVPQIRPINMADPKFKINITDAVKAEIASRNKGR
jgi:phage terminase small subunit